MDIEQTQFTVYLLYMSYLRGTPERRRKRGHQYIVDARAVLRICRKHCRDELLQHMAAGLLDLRLRWNICEGHLRVCMMRDMFPNCVRWFTQPTTAGCACSMTSNHGLNSTYGATHELSNCISMITNASCPEATREVSIDDAAV